MTMFNIYRDIQRAMATCHPLGRRHVATTVSRSTSGKSALNAVIIGGSGFLGKRVSAHLLASHPTSIVHVVSRGQKDAAWPTQDMKGTKVGTPTSRYHHHVIDMAEALRGADRADGMPTQADGALADLVREASVVINLIGIMYGTPHDFQRMQVDVPRRVAQLVKGAACAAPAAGGPRFIHVSAIGADPHATIPYARTKGLGEQQILDILPDATIVRPSLVFGEHDDFFNRFNRLADFLPFLPVFGGGTSKFQPVCVEDVAKAIVQLALAPIKHPNDQLVDHHPASHGVTYELGGPDVLTYRDIMALVLATSGKRRMILPLPWFVGHMQASVLERLPYSLFTLTRDQLRLLEKDNVVGPKDSMDPVNPGRTIQTIQDLGISPMSVHDVLPTYLAPT